MGLVEADVIRKESYQSTVTETSLRIMFDIKKMSPPFKVCVFLLNTYWSYYGYPDPFIKILYGGG